MKYELWCSASGGYDSQSHYTSHGGKFTLDHLIEVAAEYNSRENFNDPLYYYVKEIS